MDDLFGPQSPPRLFDSDDLVSISLHDHRSSVYNSFSLSCTLIIVQPVSYSYKLVRCCLCVNQCATNHNRYTQTCSLECADLQINGPGRNVKQTVCCYYI